jgi:hypothetical protein
MIKAEILEVRRSPQPLYTPAVLIWNVFTQVCLPILVKPRLGCAIVVSMERTISASSGRVAS